MDSINRQQPEDNREDLRGADAVERIRDLVKKAETCFFCTAVSVGDTGATRPMSVQEVDDEGHSVVPERERQPQESRDRRGAVGSPLLPGVRARRLPDAHRAGDREPRSQARIKKLWKPVLKTWFTEGEDDPRITVIRVAPSGGYYWDNKHGAAIAGVKMLIGAAIGKTLDDSIEGRVAP